MRALLGRGRRPQDRERFRCREGEVETGDARGVLTGLAGDERAEFSLIERGAIKGRSELFAGDVGADFLAYLVGDLVGSSHPVRLQPAVECSAGVHDEGAGVLGRVTKRRTQPGCFLQLGRVARGAFGVRHDRLGVGVDALTEQVLHLRFSDDFTGAESIGLTQPGQPRTHPHARPFTLLRVVVGEGLAVRLRHVIACDLLGQVGVTAAGRQLHQRHPHDAATPSNRRITRFLSPSGRASSSAVAAVMWGMEFPFDLTRKPRAITSCRGVQVMFS